MTDDTLIVPEEVRILKVAQDEWVIKVPSEWREIKVMGTMLIASKRHTEGDTKRWTVNYENWLDNAAKIESVDVQSSSDTCTVNDVTTSGPNVVFFLAGGVPNERVTVSLVLTDSLGNVKHDSITFTCVAQ